MAESGQSGPNLAGNGFIWLLVMAAGTLFFSQDLPLQDSRPTSVEPQILDNTGSREVDARLWQDPLAAVRKLLADKGKSRRGGAEQGGARSSAARQTNCDDATANLPHSCSPIMATDGDVLVIGVTVPGAPYGEDAESRRRYRYAVLSALDLRKYVPKDGEHIGYFTHAYSPKIVPFEWFLPAEPAPERPKILVLWIDENALAADNQPLQNLLHLVGALESPSGRSAVTAAAPEPAPAIEVAERPGEPLSRSGSSVRADAPAPKVKVKIIGPSDSGTLRDLVAEAQDSNLCANAGPSQDCALEFFDFGATVSDSALRQAVAAGTAISPDGSVEEFLRKKGLLLHRTIATDEVVAAALVKELARRNVFPGRATNPTRSCDGSEKAAYPDHVAIVSEWDTLYGRSLPETVLHALCPTATIAHRPPWMEQFSYLRGLDGQLPDTRASDDSGSGDGQSAGRRQPRDQVDDGASGDRAKRLERAEGQGQFDYLRRLAERVRRRDEELKRTGQGRIAAIGVLGSDVYDKLLVLQALRPELPEALFFTTDLDARFASRSEMRTTRNLLVASSFDLELRPEIQGAIPPFRDTYETAAFLATQLAVVNGMADCAACDGKGRLMAWTRKAQVFQIGRSALFAFPDDDTAAVGRDNPADSERCAANLDCRTIRTAGDRMFPEIRPGILPHLGATLMLGTILAATGLGYAAVLAGPYARERRSMRRTRIVHGSVVLIAVTAAALLCAFWNTLAAWATGHGEGEPMVLIAGISVWPTVLIRLASFAICVLLILYSLRRLDHNIDEIARQLRLDELRNEIIARERAADLERSWWEKLHNVLSLHLRRAPMKLPNAQDNDKLIDFWRTYVYRGRKGARATRAFLCIVMMMALWVILSTVFGEPNVPARYWLTRDIYFVVTTADVFATLFLIFLVADATIFSCLFLRELRRAGAVWPRQSTRKFRAFLGVDGSSVDDWISTKFIALRTKCIIGLIYFPFIMVAMLIVSRSSFLDSFAPNLTLIVSQGASLAVLIGCVVWLRWEAEQMRKTVKMHLTDALIGAKGDEASEESRDAAAGGTEASRRRERRAARLQELIDDVDSLQEGAFSPISHQPMLRAVLLPLGTYGGSALVDYLSRVGI
jgi:hypothetical protein